MAQVDLNSDHPHQPRPDPRHNWQPHPRMARRRDVHHRRLPQLQPARSARSGLPCAQAGHRRQPSSKQPNL
eukprot:4934681-Prymnesium_polylepis.1